MNLCTFVQVSTWDVVRANVWDVVRANGGTWLELTAGGCVVLETHVQADMKEQRKMSSKDGGGIALFLVCQNDVVSRVLCDWHRTSTTPCSTM